MVPPSMILEHFTDMLTSKDMIADFSLEMKWDSNDESTNIDVSSDDKLEDAPTG